MSILIKDMEMPKSCAGCALYRFGCTMEGKCWNVCAASGKDLDNPFGIGIPVWCPLVSVPEPHGKLIDVDAADEDAYDELELANTYRTGWEAARAMQKHYQNSPTIIPAEEKET